jgi:hypothetical protein
MPRPASSAVQECLRVILPARAAESRAGSVPHGCPATHGTRSSSQPATQVGDVRFPDSRTTRTPVLQLWERATPRTQRPWQMCRERNNVPLIRSPAVQQHDERRELLARRGANDHRRRKVHVSAPKTTPSSPAVATPLQRAKSPSRSNGSIGAAVANWPHVSRGNIHMISNSLPSGSAP